MKPKVALVKDGFLPAGSENKRGRLSGAAIERCKELVAKGWRIEGYSSSSTADSEEKTVKKVAVATNEKVVSDFTILYDEKVYKAITSNAKEYGMREVCNTCRVSLVQNHCDNPTILGGIAVTIVPR